MNKNDKWFIIKSNFIRKLAKSSSIYKKRDILPEKRYIQYSIKFPTFGSIVSLKVLTFFSLTIIDKKSFGILEIKIYHIDFRATSKKKNRNKNLSIGVPFVESCNKITIDSSKNISNVHWSILMDFSWKYNYYSNRIFCLEVEFQSSKRCKYYSPYHPTCECNLIP